MHETMVAQSLLAAISSESAKVGARPVAAKVSCGKLYTINEEALQFAFEALAKGTPCEGVRVSVQQIEPRAKCRDCGEQFEPDIESPGCPACGSERFELLPDAPMLLEEIEFEEPANDVQTRAQKKNSE